MTLPTYILDRIDKLMPGEQLRHGDLVIECLSPDNPRTRFIHAYDNAQDTPAYCEAICDLFAGLFYEYAARYEQDKEQQKHARSHPSCPVCRDGAE